MFQQRNNQSQNLEQQQLHAKNALTHYANKGKSIARFTLGMVDNKILSLLGGVLKHE